MPTLLLFDEALNNIGKNVIDLDSHTFKAMLSNVAPVQATGSVKTDITEIAAGNGYVAGGVTLTGVTWTETGAGTGIWRFACNQIDFTASGGSIAANRYMVVYDDTAASDELVGYVDYGVSSVIPDTVTRRFTDATGLFDMTRSP